jgi:hypothetical protein
VRADNGVSLASLIVDAPELHPVGAAWRAAPAVLRAALERGRAALGAVLGRAGRLADGRRLVELSASYLRELSAWAARQVQRWIAGLPGVEELRRPAALAAGAALRALAAGRRHGRLFALPEPAARALAALCGVQLGAAADVLVPLPARRGPRTCAVRCPAGDAHRTGDSSPSLVLWPVPTAGPWAGRGAARCLACGLRGSWAPSADGAAAALRVREWRAGAAHNNKNPLGSSGAALVPSSAPPLPSSAPPRSASMPSSGPEREHVGSVLPTPGSGGGEPPRAAPAWCARPLPGAPPAPTGAAGPVGGLVAGPLRLGGRGGATVGAALRRAPGGGAALSRGHRLAGGPLAALRSAERAAARAERSGADGAREAAHLAALAHRGAPVLGASSGRESADQLDVLDVPWRLLRTSAAVYRSACGPGERPGWRDVRQDAVLVDIDAIDLPADPLAVERAAARAVRAVLADPEIGAALAVQTSPRGVQLWCELRAPRREPDRWWSLPAVRAWHAQLGAVALAELRAAGACGGLVDGAAARAGGWGRRPGWRLDRAGRPWRVRLVADSADSA